jgi:hypothetical protein
MILRKRKRLSRERPLEVLAKSDGGGHMQKGKYSQNTEAK